MFKFLFNIFSSKNNKKEESVTDTIDNEIKLYKQQIEEKKELKDKYCLYRKIIYLLIKRKALLSKSSYLKRAFKIIEDNYFEDNLYETLSFLESIDIEKLSKDYLYEIFTFKALLLEALEEFSEASKTYKYIINLINDIRAVEDFNEYVKRYNSLLSWQKKSKEKIVLENLYNIHEKTPINELPKSAKSLENIALYYAKSPKSRNLAKRYFKEVLKIYKKLYQYDKKIYSCDYIKALIDGVEFFMLSPILLKEAQKLLEKPNLCLKNRIYLIERLKELKEKNFIKMILK